MKKKNNDIRAPSPEDKFQCDVRCPYETEPLDLFAKVKRSDRTMFRTKCVPRRGGKCARENCFLYMARFIFEIQTLFFQFDVRSNRIKKLGAVLTK